MSFELLNAWLIGPDEFWWSVRQAAALGAMAVASTFAVMSARMTKNPKESSTTGLLFGATFSLAFSVHPFVLELVSWPFMWMQIACLACMALSLYWLTRFIAVPSKRAALLAALFAYASMHFFGVGLAISAAMLVSLFFVSHALKAVRTALPALLIGLIATLLHTVPSIMADDTSGPIRYSDSVARFIFLVSEQPISIAHAVFVSPALAIPDVGSIHIELLPASLAILAVVGIVVYFWIDAIKERSQAKITSAASITFPLLTYLGTCLLIVARLRAEADDASLIQYVVGGRYLIFPMFYSIFILAVALPSNRFAMMGCVGALLASMVFSAFFVRNIAPEVWPERVLSHQEVWTRMTRNPDQDIDLSRYGEFKETSCRYADLIGGQRCPGEKPAVEIADVGLCWVDPAKLKGASNSP